MRKITAIWLILMLLGAVCAAEEQETETETAHRVVSALFAAAAGTDAETEMALRLDMTEEQQQERNAVSAAYRETVFPWLADVLTRDDEEEHLRITEEMTEEEQTAYRDALDHAYTALSENDFGRQYLDILDALGAWDRDTCLSKTREYFRVWLSEIEPERLTGLNDDFTFWLYSQDSPIDYPVVQAEDNIFYLHRMFNGANNSAGTLFMDYRNLPDLLDPNTLVYGHHMNNGSMFGSLVKYKDQAYFESHPYMLIVGRNEIDIVQVFSGYTTHRSDECYDIAISDEDDLMEFVEIALEKSDFVCEPVILANDRLITMSTCAYTFQNARYIVIGRLETVWRGEDTDMEWPGERAE